MNFTNQKEYDFSSYYINLYKKEYAPMSKDEVRDLINKAQSGDKNAFDCVLLRNLALVIKYAYQYSFACEVEDLIQQGVLGLMEAINHFDTSTDYAFSTYAWHWVRQSITRYINNFGSSIRYPVHVKEKLRQYKKIMGDYPYGFLSDKYIFLDKYQFAKIHHAVSSQDEFIAMEDLVEHEYIYSLECEIFGEENSVGTLKETLEDKNINIEGDFLTQESVIQIYDVMDRMLTEKQITVLTLRYGLDNNSEPMTLEEVGHVLNLTRERVRQIQSKALSIIKQNLTRLEKE